MENITKFYFGGKGGKFINFTPLAKMIKFKFTRHDCLKSHI
ncbi:hypothetical protein [uncultured Campylobacter sp.]|nr:hypothetical protein [uncultured Campylobacter sp.]